jgi:hypothetical protein
VYKYYVKDVLARKSEASLSTRWDQSAVLMDNLTEGVVYTIFGRGLGNTVDVVTPARDYRGDYYFELQTLYILNQIGIFGFLIFIIYNLRIIFVNYKKSYLVFLYFCYIIYSVTNPYIFDSVNVAVIFILNSLMHHDAV